MMFRQNSRNFPIDTMEAARIDGLNEFQIFYRMYMPMMKSTYAAAAVITFMNAWNSYLWPRVILTDPKAQTMPLLIANLASGYTTDYGLLMMGVLFCSVPTMIVFFILQNSLQKVSQVLSSKKNKKEKRLPFLAAFFYIRNQRGRYNCQERWVKTTG